MISDGLRFSFILSIENNKDKLILLFENSPLNTNPVVIKAYNKKKKRIVHTFSRSCYEMS